MYGQKKEGADYSYENTYSYQVEYVTLAETGDVLHQELREGNCYSSSGLSEILPGILDRVSKQFNHLRYRVSTSVFFWTLSTVVFHLLIKLLLVRFVCWDARDPAISQPV